MRDFIFIAIMALILAFCTGVASSYADEDDEPDEEITPCAVESYADELPEITQLDGNTVEVLAKLVYGEAGGIPSKTEQAAVVWCVLNRADMEPDRSIIDIAVKPRQYVGYRPTNPVTPEIKALVEDVLLRWQMEKRCVGEVGRVLPADYIYFSGDGEHNHFRNEFRGGEQWDWSLPSPYEE